MAKGPNDRIKSAGKKSGTPKIFQAINIKIPDKEVHLMQPSESAPEGGGTCSCHSVCSCVPVSDCNCDMVCTCDAVCNSNNCTCNKYYGCTGHMCACQPECSHGGGCSTVICTCVPVIYRH